MESFGRFAMRPKERKDSGSRDLFRSWLEQIVDMNHSLAKLSRLIDWKFIVEDLYPSAGGHLLMNADFEIASLMVAR